MVRKHSRAAAVFRLLVPYLLSELTGCMVVDAFGPRLDAFNEEAGASKARVLVINVLRSAYSEPLEFDNLATVLGTASASATVGASLPIVTHMPAVSYTFSPSVMASGGPQFTAQFLDTKEFLLGLQAPISKETIASLDATFPIELVLPLLIQEMEFQSPGGTLHRLLNTGLNEGESTRFGNAVQQLANAGLSTEQFTETAPTGPPITDSKTANDEQAKGLTVKPFTVPTTFPSTDDPSLTKQEYDGLKAKHVTLYYKEVKSMTTTRFCFDPIKYDERQKLIANQNPVILSPLKIPSSVALFEGMPDAVLTILPSYVCGAKMKREGAQEVLRFVPRTTEGVIDYLGQIARLELGLVDGDSKSNSEAGPLVWVGNRKARLFTISRGKILTRAISVSRGLGEEYSVPIDPYRNDLSGTVLRILSELITLNSSAKDLPLPSVIPVIVP